MQRPAKRALADAKPLGFFLALAELIERLDRCMTNALYYGDNLSVLRESIATESIDLISTRRSTPTLPTTSCVFDASTCARD